MNMHCPKCGNKTNFSTERRPNGDSTCLACSFKAPTARFQMPVTEIWGGDGVGPMPSPRLSPKDYMLALAEKLKAAGDRDMTQGECKNLELAESTIREKEGTTEPADNPGPFDSMTRIELVKQCETLSAQLTDVLNESISQAKEANDGLSELQESTVEHRSRIEALDEKLQAMADGADTAWGIIANAKDWLVPMSDTEPEWIAAAKRWRDEFYHPMLDMLLKPKGVVEPVGPVKEVCATCGLDADGPRNCSTFGGYHSGQPQWPTNNERPPLATNVGPDVPTPPASGEWVPRWVAINLWQLLDDIDTFSDMFKDNYEGLAKAVYKRQRQRFAVGISDGYRVEFNGYKEPPRETRDCGNRVGLHYLIASVADYVEKGEVDMAFASVWIETVADMVPEVVKIRNSRLVPNCPPCPVNWEDIADASLNGRICAEELFSMGFSRWNEKGDEAEGEDLFSGGTLWLCPVNWYDELPKDFDFITLNGDECRVDAGASKDSRMGYLAFGIVWFEKPAG